jgi:hypothetical protein
MYHQKSNYSSNYSGMHNKHKNSSNHHTNYSTDDINKIIDYIYSTTEISRFKYKILEYENDLNLITTHKYYISANFSGTSSLLVFVRIMDRYYSCLIDRKTLSYNRHQIKTDSVKIIPINIRLDSSIYHGTIMDGIHVYNKRTNTNVFIMTDIYQFRGSNMTNDMIQHKIMNVTAYLNANLKQDNKTNSLNIVINKLYEITEIEDLRKTMDHIGGYETKGIIFYPEISGTKLIFLDMNPPKTTILNKESTKDLVKDKENNTGEMKEPPELKKVSNKKKTKYRYVCKSDNQINSVLELRKTEQPDVYFVSCADRTHENGKNIIKIIRLGIALIPSKEISVMCKTLMANKTHGKMLMKCKFDQDKNKWIPIEEEKIAKLPTLLSEIEKDMELVIESDNDSDD